MFLQSLSHDKSTRVAAQPQCGACGLYKSCKSPKMPVDGQGRKGLLIVGEAPGEEEDKRGVPFIGPSGKRLQHELRRHGWDMRRDCWVTNAVVCRPPRNATPGKEIAHCLPNVVNAVKRLQPTGILLLGTAAVQSVVGWLWRPDCGGVERWAGWRVPAQQINAWVCPTYHPAYVLRARDEAPGLWFGRHIRAALKTVEKGRPWDVVPDYRKEVRGIISPTEATKAIEAMHEHKRMVAFDYETDRLKPEPQDSRVVCCALSDGATTIAYPWQGAAKLATRLLLRDPEVPKVAANMNFELRWTRRHLGCSVRNLYFDTVLGNHTLDHREGVNGVKFQAFARLGQPRYDAHIEPYLSAPSDNERNNIHKVELPELLRYCGLDALLEWQLAVLMTKELGLKPGGQK